jgi:hypothetical protein
MLREAGHEWRLMVTPPRNCSPGLHCGWLDGASSLIFNIALSARFSRVSVFIAFSIVRALNVAARSKNNDITFSIDSSRPHPIYNVNTNLLSFEIKA